MCEKGDRFFVPEYNENWTLEDDNGKKLWFKCESDIPYRIGYSRESFLQGVQEGLILKLED